MKHTPIFTLAAITLIVAGPTVAQEQPVPVSPGSVNQASSVDQRCPSFSWAGVDRAESYELAVFAIQDGSEPEAVLERSFPAGARSWTPSGAECLERGGQYGWSVRAVGAEVGAEWSQVRLFEVEALPSDEEVRAAMATLRRHLASNQEPAGGRAETLTSNNQQPTTNNRTGSGSHNPEPITPESDGGQALSASTVAALPSPQTVTTPSSFSLNLSGDVELGGFVFKEGVPFIHTQGVDSTAVGMNALALGSNLGIRNTAFGYGALKSNVYGSGNVALGYSTLHANTDGRDNTAVGMSALRNNVDGESNVAVGFRAMLQNTQGTNNVAVGEDALISSDGFFNTAVGHDSLQANTSGSRNAAVGVQALYNNTTGDGNTAIGDSAGFHWDSGMWNIAVGAGAQGYSGETGTIRIGGLGFQSYTFIEGIFGTTTDINDAIPVLIDSAGQLGTVSSSARVKEDIHDLDEASERLLDLRPVSFRYRKPFKNGDKPIQYGLIAEEVAEIFPELVVYNADGEPETVKYHLLSTLLLNELLKQQSLNAVQQDELIDLRRQMADRDRVVGDLKRHLERVLKRK